MGTQRKKLKSGKSRFKTQTSNIKKNSLNREKKIAAQVHDLAEPLCEAEGMELVYVEYQCEARGRILRVYIDKPGGVTLDDCVYVSRQLGDLLDVSIEHIGKYSLEVSSPGIDRPLGKQSDFERFKGNKAKIRTSEPVDGKAKFQGILYGITDNIVLLLVNDKKVLIPYHTINRARLVNYNGENGC